MFYGYQYRGGQASAIYVGATPVSAVYVGETKVWPTLASILLDTNDIRSFFTVSDGSIMIAGPWPEDLASEKIRAVENLNTGEYFDGVTATGTGETRILTHPDFTLGYDWHDAGYLKIYYEP